MARERVSSSPRRYKMSRRSFLSGVGHLAVAGSAVALSGSAFALSYCTQPSALEHAVVGNETSSLRVGIDFSRPPFESLTAQDVEQAVPVGGASLRGFGFNVSLLQRVGASLGRNMHFVNVDCADLTDCLKKGFVDVAASSYLNASDDQSLAFSHAYRSYDLGVVCRADSPWAQADSLASLAGARMEARRDSDLQRAIASIDGVVTQGGLDPDVPALPSIQDGALDATVVERHAFASIADEVPDLVLAPLPSRELAPASSGLALAVRAQDTQLLSKLNCALNAVGDVEQEEMWDSAVSLWRQSAPIYI